MFSNDQTMSLKGAIYLLSEYDNTKQSFLEAGYYGLLRLAQAIMLSGVTCPQQITNLACAICGEDIRDEFSFMLEEGVDENWAKDEPGHLYL